MTITDRIRRLHRCAPQLTAPQIAAQIGCRVEYVRAIKRRFGLRIPKAIKYPEHKAAT